MTLTAKSTTLCVVCKSKIVPGALICTVCKNPQDWTRHVLKWKDVIAAILTATPLVAGAWSLYKIAAQPDRPRPYAFAVECRLGEAKLALGNDGTAATFLRLPELTVLREDKEEPASVGLGIEKADAYPTILSAKQTAVVTVRAVAGGVSSEFSTLDQKGPSCRLQFRIQAEDALGKIIPLATQCQCPSR